MCLVSKPITVLLLTLQLSSLLVVDDHHLEDVVGLPHALQTLKSHDCGSKELHKDIPHFCLACLRQANAGFAFPAIHLPSVVQSLSIIRLASTRSFRQFDIYISASKRGPPPSLS